MAATNLLEAVQPVDSMFKLRSYQQEMLQRSLDQNVIVAMETGSGKTHVAIARIRAELERTGNHDLIWFLAPSRTLAEQQYKTLHSELSAYGVRLLTGADGVEKWTDQKLWDAVFANIRVLVATPAVLSDALSHAFISISRIALCVFDEAHRCTKNHPMNQIMRDFYRPARQRGERIPHILGLSASPVMSTKQGTLEAIESNLHSRAVTPKLYRDELEHYVNPPEFQTITYHTARLEIGSVCAALASETRNYNIMLDPYVLHLRQEVGARAEDKLLKTLSKRNTYCLKELQALDLRASELHEQLGPSMAEWYLSICIDKFRLDSKSANAQPLELSDLERAHLLGIFERVADRPSTSVPPCHAQATPKLSDKASRLIGALQEQYSPSVRGIVFVEQRVQVTAIAELIRNTSQLSELYSVASYVGTSTNARRKSSVADLAALSNLEHDLQMFREGSKNLIIATNVLEEGIDIAACNLVICFDPPKNLVSFVQRRGRARQFNSKYILFGPSDATANEAWSAREAEMKAVYADESRTLSPEYAKDEPQRSYIVPSTGALLTMDDAKAHLFHFCSVSILATKYVDLRPQFDSNQDPETSLWTAQVELPPSVHTSLRHAKSSRPWVAENQAMKDAAFEAYIALHRAGLVNNHLLPLIKDYGPEVGLQHGDQPSMVQIMGPKSLLRVHWPDTDAEMMWSSATVQLFLHQDLIIEATLWLPSSIPSVRSFDLHYNAQITYNVHFLPHGSAEILTIGEIRHLRACTAAILYCAHANRMPPDQNDFAVLLTTDHVIELLKSPLPQKHSRTAAGVINTVSGVEECGLVRVTSQQGRPYFLDSINRITNELIVRSFPKRKDFLHTVADDSNAYTGMQTFKIDECTIDVLPSKYALLSAFVPSILHKLETSLLAQDLALNKLNDVGFQEVSLVLEAITAPAAQEPYNYNRLEYLGDCVLKFCAEIHVMSQHIDWPEAFLSFEKDRIVRNSNLAKIAIHFGLDGYIITAPFTGSKWRPPYVSDKREPSERKMSSKILADVVEALIGAAFVDGGLEKGARCIKTLLPGEDWVQPQLCIDKLLNELDCPSINNLAPLERLIGHIFNHPTLLAEAITHVSYPFNKGGLSYERLEFLGDSILDMIITPKLFAHSRNLKHWELHGIHEALVNSHFLGFCCLRYAECCETFDAVQDEAGAFRPVRRGRDVHLYDFLRAGTQLSKDKSTVAADFQQHSEQISHALATGHEYPWIELVTLSPPKFFCDLVEAIIGAIFLDTRGDFAPCEAFLDRLGVIEIMHRLLDENVQCGSPKEMLGVVADRAEVKYISGTTEVEGGRRAWQCSVQVGGVSVVAVEGCRTRYEAEVKAAHAAVRVLQKTDAVKPLKKKRKMDTTTDSTNRQTSNVAAGGVHGAA